MKKKKKEIVINNCYGGFSLSREAFLELRKMGNEYALKETDEGEYYSDGSGPRHSYGFDNFLSCIPRDDKDLISIIKKLKKKANGSCAYLKIIKIPVDIEYIIQEYDGNEWVAEAHRTWS